jgi:hypothetical protein
MHSFHSLRSRRRALRLEALEARVVPVLSIGTQVSFGGSIGVPPIGNSGAIGPNHYVLMQVQGFAIFDRSGNLLTDPLATDTSFWEGLGVSNTVTVQGLLDPRVIYDADSQRWFVTETNGATTNNTVLLAVSDTNDPTGTWKVYSFNPTATAFTAFPTLAVDHAAVYIGGATMVSGTNFTPSGTTMTTIPKADLTGTTPTLANLHTVSQGTSGSNRGWAPSGVSNTSSTDTTGMIVATHQTTFGFINVTDVTVPATGNPTYGTVANRSIPFNALPGKIRQPAPSQTLSGGDDDRYASSVIQVGDLVYAVHAISVDSNGDGAPFVAGVTTDGIQLIVISDLTNQVLATETYFDANYDFSYPSVAANQFGDIVIGFNRSGFGADGNLGAYAVYAKFTAGSPATITFGQQIQLMAGSATNYNQQGNDPEEWGDYSAITVDPTNPFAFWTTQEYAVTDVKWSSRVTEILIGTGVSSVGTTTADGTYHVGDHVQITVKFSGAVNATGAPRLALNSGGTANYLSGSGTDTLVFDYVVGLGQSAADLDYASATALTLNGGTIKDAVDNSDASLILPAPGGTGSLGAAANIVIDTSAPSVSGVNSTTPNGTYTIGDTVSITVTFNRTVTVTGSPQLALNSGGTAQFVSASGATLTFTYTVAAGQSSADLDANSAGALTGGSITDPLNGGQPANRTLPIGAAAGSLAANKSLVIDALAPHVTDVNSPSPNQTYHYLDSVSITVTFNHPVTVTGTPTIALNSGGTASYASGSGTSTLVFTYVVGAGNVTSDLDASSTTALTGGTIVDAGSQAADRTLPTPGQLNSLSANKNIVIDATQAIVTNVTSTAINRTYGPGEVITFTVQYNRPVVVDVTGGTPTIALNSGGTATYSSTQGTSTLVFTYTVATGEYSPDLDAASASALSLNGGTIQDSGGLPAVLTLPTPGQPGSLSANKNIAVDGLGPTVVHFYVLFGSKKYDLLTSTRVTDLPWMITGVQVEFSEAVATGNARSLGGFRASRFTGLRTKVLTWRFPAITKGSFTATLANSGLNALKDKFGNPIAAPPMSFDVLYGDFTDDGVVDAADEAGVRAHLTPPLQLHPANYNLFADLSGDGLVNLIDVGVTRIKKGTSLP